VACCKPAQDDPTHSDALYGAGRAAEMLNIPDKAADYCEQFVKICAGSNSDRQEQAYARGVSLESRQGESGRD
jgi:hypothetical protein